MKSYDYIIIGAGIAGCTVAYELAKHNDNILLVDKLSDVSLGASGAAGAFLSPLLGKPNDFKDLVTNSLKYSTKFYQENFPELITNCGTTRIPQNEEDKKKFESYIPYMDFDYTNEEDGFFFEVGSVVDSYSICKKLIKNATNDVETKFDYEVKDLVFQENNWVLNDELKCKNIIFTTGSEVSLIKEFYLKIRAVWGCRIDVSTTTSFSHNYHKACSISKSKQIDDTHNIVSIGATHHREKKGIEDIETNISELLLKANDIKKIENVAVLKHYIGSRACSIDYFPIVGDIINSKETLAEFPYMVNGTNVEHKRFTRFPNSYILTGVGGRGFVLSPYLAKQLVEKIINKKEVDENLRVDRLFKREVKRYTNPLGI
jgi:glycine/D-amino acid oxidase-like deaminating enzyme